MVPSSTRTERPPAQRRFRANSCAGRGNARAAAPQRARVSRRAAERSRPGYRAQERYPPGNRSRAQRSCCSARSARAARGTAISFPRSWPRRSGPRPQLRPDSRRAASAANSCAGRGNTRAVAPPSARSRVAPGRGAEQKAPRRAAGSAGVVAAPRVSAPAGRGSARAARTRPPRAGHRGRVHCVVAGGA